MKKLVFGLLLGGLFLTSCGGAKKAPVKGVILGKLQVIQNSVAQPADKANSKVELERGPFQIGFTNYPYSTADRKFYATQIVAFTNKKMLDPLKEGAMINEISFLKAGTGLAALGPYKDMYVDGSNEHHYIIFEEGNDERAKKVQRLEDGQLMMTWTISSFNMGGSKKSVSNSRMEKLYLGVVQDKNLNKKIDEGELHKIEVTFK